MLTTGKATGLLSMFALIAMMQASEVCGQSSGRLLGQRRGQEITYEPRGPGSSTTP